MAPGLQNDPGVLQQEAGFGFDQFIWCESRDLGLTAIGTTQGGALQLNKMVNQITAAAASSSPFNGVILPPARATIIGATICVINAAPNPINVYGAPGGSGSDSINGMSGAAGAIMQASSVAYFLCMAAQGVGGAATGAWIATGLGFGYGTGNSSGFTTYSSQDNITATPSGSQSTSLLLYAAQSRITTVTTAGDGVRLPPAIAGMEMTVLNDAAANAMNVFPASQAQGGASGGDSINAATQNTALSVAASNGAAGGPVIFYCFSAGKWRTK